MTKAELINMLERLPDHAVVRIHDAESGEMEEVTGSVSGVQHYRGAWTCLIDLHSDDIS